MVAIAIASGDMRCKVAGRILVEIDSLYDVIVISPSLHVIDVNHHDIGKFSLVGNAACNRRCDD
jgi:hypothetical protein